MGSRAASAKVLMRIGWRLQACRYRHRGPPRALERVECRSDILGSPYFECRDVEAERACCGLNFVPLEHGGGIADIGHDR